MRYYSIPPEWAGQDCAILAGGASIVRLFDKAFRNRFRIIAINGSYRLVPDADVLYFCDHKWWLRFSDRVRSEFLGKRIVTLENEIERVLRLRDSGEVGLDTDPSCLRTGGNSAYQAINLAYHFGVKRIFLFGVDLIGNHWHADYDTAQHVLNGFRPKFEQIVQPLQDAGIQLFNCSDSTLLDCWPILRSPKEVLDVLRNGYGQDTKDRDHRTGFPRTKAL